MDDDTPYPGEPPKYDVAFVDDRVYDEFSELDGPEFRDLMDEIRDDPYPNGRFRQRIPDQPGRYFAYQEVDGMVCKMTYRIDVGERQIVILAVSVQQLPMF